MDVQRFSSNAVGRDFVVADLHGCFAQLERALARVAFDPERDRVFSVGDLVDRGPRSEDALHWLAQPWFHACRGNHEQVIVELGSLWRGEEAWFHLNGGGWWLALPHRRQQAFLRAFAALPFALEVSTRWGRVGIVHADVEASWPAFCDALERGDPQARHVAVWSRRRASGAAGGPVAGIDRVVCGHTVTPDGLINVRHNVWFIDTGAFLEPDGERLTLVHLRALFAHHAPVEPRWARGL